MKIRHAVETEAKPKSLALFIATLALLVSCYAAFVKPHNEIHVADSVSTLDKIKATGTLNAAYVAYPPFVSVDPSSRKPSGYFIDLMAEIARKGGFEVKYEEVSLATMIAGLNTGKFDTVVSAVFSSVPRAKEAKFTHPVLFVGMSAITRADDDRIQAIEDLRKPGLRFAVLAGGSGRQYLLDNLPDAVRIEVEGTDLTRPMLEVLAGRADIALSESIGCSRFAKQHPGARDVFENNPYAVFGTCLVVRSSDDDWREFLNVALDRLQIDGTIARLDTKYKESISESAWFSKALPWRVKGGQ